MKKILCALCLVIIFTVLFSACNEEKNYKEKGEPGMSIYISPEEQVISETVPADSYASPAPPESISEVANAKSVSDDSACWQTTQVKEFTAVTGTVNDRGEVTGEIRRSPSE